MSSTGLHRGRNTVGLGLLDFFFVLLRNDMLKSSGRANRRRLTSSDCGLDCELMLFFCSGSGGRGDSLEGYGLGCSCLVNRCGDDGLERLDLHGDGAT